MIVDFRTIYADVKHFLRTKSERNPFLTREFILVVQVLFACFLFIVTATVNMRKYKRSRTRAVMFTDADVDTVSSLETTFCLANLKFLEILKFTLGHDSAMLLGDYKIFHSLYFSRKYERKFKTFDKITIL